MLRIAMLSAKRLMFRTIRIVSGGPINKDDTLFSNILTSGFEKPTESIEKITNTLRITALVFGIY